MHIGLIEKHPLYRTRQGMIDRCFNSRSKNFKGYGSRGITICEFLRGHPNNLLSIIGYRPSPSHSIDRPNNDGSYTCGSCAQCVQNRWPLNVRWATKTEQIRNRRNTIMITKGAVTMPAASWSETLGVPLRTIVDRKKKGDTGEALLRPIPKTKHEIDGVSLTCLEWERKTGIDHRTIESRFRSGLRGRDLIGPLKIKRTGKIQIGEVSKTLKEWARDSGQCYETLLGRFKKGLRGHEILTRQT